MKLPKPSFISYSDLITYIKDGRIKIPQFQRDFVWSVQKSTALMDSVIKGYPIGTFVFWETKDRLRSVRNLGNVDLPLPKDGEKVSFVLDGQQRLTSLFATLQGLTIERNSGQRDDFSKIYVDLETNANEQIVVMGIENRDKKSFISLSDLLHGGIKKLAAYPESKHEKLDDYRKRIEQYNFSRIEVQDVALDVATEIFTRINVSGQTLTLFEIMVAKTYDESRNFDLAEKFDELISKFDRLDYETISDATVLQLISLIMKKDCRRQTILNLKKDKFIDTWPHAVEALESAVEHFRGVYGIPVSKLIPYNALLAAFGYFFAHHPEKPDLNQTKLLEDFFWKVSLAGRYSSSVESKLAQDAHRMDSIIDGNLPVYDWAIDLSPKFIVGNGWFNAGRAFVKAILCLFAFQKPQSFRDNSFVNLRNDWLKRINSKNYHHFFPRAYLKKQGVDDWKANNIVNITIVDDYLNKKVIHAKAPSIYMKLFDENPDLDKTMKTHLISNLNEFGVFRDDYERFLDRRASEISKELKNRVIVHDTEKFDQTSPRADDFEEEPTARE